MFDYLKKTFSLDLRALGLLRIGLGFLVILDSVIRMDDLEVFYTDKGAFPLNVLFNHQWNVNFFSLHTISGSWWVELALFLFTIVCGFFLLIGWQTRLFTFLSWVMILSVQNRNPMILQGGDDLLRLSLLWAIFLPLNKYYSVDRLFRRVSPALSTQYFSMANIGYMIQVASVYIFSVLLKTSDEWTVDGTAVYYALSLDQIAMPLGKLLYPYPEVLKVLTFCVYYTEIIAPMLLFIPVRNQRFRAVGIILLSCLQLGFGTTLFVGLFFIIGLTTLTGLYPSFWMDKIDTFLHSLGKKLKPSIIHFFRFTNNWIKLRLEVRPNFKVHKVVREGFFVGIVIYCLMWNIGNSPQFNYQLNLKARALGYMFRLDQNWGMFAPSVFKDDGWFVLEGVTADSLVIDLKRNGDTVIYSKPTDVLSTYKNDRWRKYSENYLFVHNSFMRLPFCFYQLREWNQKHPEKPIQQLRVVYMKEVSQPDYKVPPATREELCNCR